MTPCHPEWGSQEAWAGEPVPAAQADYGPGRKASVIMCALAPEQPPVPRDSHPLAKSHWPIHLQHHFLGSQSGLSLLPPPPWPAAHCRGCCASWSWRAVPQLPYHPAGAWEDYEAAWAQRNRHWGTVNLMCWKALGLPISIFEDGLWL